MRSNDSDAPHPPRGRVLAAARERFLTAGSVDSNQVRETIAASWWRSKSWKVEADHVQLAYARDPDLETPLVLGAAPVLNRLQEQVSDEPVSVILTDAAGLVLDRRTGDRRLERHLDRVQLAPGFSYAEQFVGTNGIGTALEGRQATGVFGHEHYAEGLEEFGCFGVPVRHPVSGQLLGVLDLTCWSRDASPLLSALAKATAEHIERELTTMTGLREFALFEEYLRACRHSRGIVFALNNDVVMMNDHARQALTASDQAALLATAVEAMRGKKRVMIDRDLPSGARVRMSCAPVHTPSGPAGGVFRVRLTGTTARPRPGTPAFRPMLPGLVGSSAVWQRALEQVRTHYRAGEWITVHGEAGTGKLALLRAVYRHHEPAGRFRVLDAAEATGSTAFLTRVREELQQGSGALVLRHIDRLPPDRARALTDLLRSHQRMHQRRRAAGQDEERLWVTATHCSPGHDQDLAGLLRVFPAAMEVPPLRHHIDDMAELVPFLLAKLTSPTTLTCSPAAMRLLMRATWPGNVAQLRKILSTVVQHRRSGVMEASDLPPECQTVSRRVLSPLESLERDAIVRSLIDANGNRSRAARALGVSRATIYRKIHEYGIELPQP
ncbi:sigma-54-dependent Fis family transcriptional regulator [Streptomyces rugosispiralis]|uniref:Siderophore-interacting protein n=1 Tax=Streptomyces rugosispiralis TaxID=2967341 RepID=A0ABT1UPP6_9ACTN|nr:helix-turn-helix domain-containing protein [Streptomyces rugosispiralis]MCQ8186951.1 siderophore-interacting protein [Streptomyces rugosispiralis]